MIARMVSTPPIDLSYASPCDGRLARLFIHLIEATTGQLELKRLYLAYQTELRGTVNFWEAALRLMQLSVVYDPAKLDALPRTGPLVQFETEGPKPNQAEISCRRVWILFSEYV